MSASGAQTDHSFFWRKLHSLTGILPIGAYLADHFWSNSYALVSVAKYNEKSQELQTVPWRIFLEAGIIWLPLLYHGIYGVYVWWKGKSNVSQYPWVGNWAYAIQRWTGLIAFVFIGWHVYTERILTGGKSTYNDVQHMVANPWYLAFYLIGVVAASIHLGNGLWNFLCKWGLAATARSQRAAGYLGTAVAFLFSAAGVTIVLSFRYHWHPWQHYIR